MPLHGFRGTLVWRLVLIGCVQLIVLGAAVIGVGVLLVHMQVAPPYSSLSPPHHGLDPQGPLLDPQGPLLRRHHPWPVAPLVTFLLSGLVIVGVGAFLTARWLLRPLETLSDAARALGSGDLRARTGLKRQDELGNVGRVFDDMAERIECLLMAERELLANVSHELRTPLARIGVALDLAGEGDGEAERKSLAEIRLDLSEIEDLINDIMTTARLDVEHGRLSSSGFSLHFERLSPLDLSARAATRFRARCPGRSLVVESSNERLPAILADPVLFRRVLDNLLENAHKYSPDLGKPVLLRTSAAADRVTFEVTDAGVGISEEDIPHVFAPFFRSERSRSRAGGGVGLGLTLVRRIVEAHAGSVDIASAVGRGTTVRVRLPAALEVKPS